MGSYRSDNFSRPCPAAYHFRHVLELFFPHGAGDAPVRVTPVDPAERAATRELAQMLLGSVRIGDGDPPELPSLPDLITTVVALAEGTRRKVLLPLGGTPAEFALVRRGDEILVSCYDTGPAPEPIVLDRKLDLARLLDQCATAARQLAETRTREAERTRLQTLAARAADARIAPDREDGPTLVQRVGGEIGEPDDGVPLAFGFTAAIPPGVGRAPGPLAEPDDVARADVHALLFEGRLWGWARGRRVMLARGPILLAVQRMVAAVRALIDAATAGRSANVRLRAGCFLIGVRLERTGEVSLTLGGDDEGPVTVSALDVRAASLPVLRVATDLVRALIAVDRAQARNLRVRALRDEVRTLRRALRALGRDEAFLNDDPDRLRLGSTVPPDADDAAMAETLPPPEPARGRLRFAERWRAEIDGLDATSTFLCGDRLVLATPRRTLALARDEGEVMWERTGPLAAAVMTGTVLLRLAPDGGVELCDVQDGDAYARTRIAPRVGAPVALLAGGGAVPPVAILAEGTSRLVAIDLRTGEPRWRFAARAPGAFRLRRAGRVLLVVSGDRSLTAIDVASGEVAWRYSDVHRLTLEPAVFKDIVVAATGEPSGSAGALVAIDLFTGSPRWRRELDAAPAAAPVAAGTLAAIALSGAAATSAAGPGSQRGRRSSLAAFDPATGELRWMTPDPGIAAGGASLAVDRHLVVNAPGGRVTALGLETGELAWTQTLAQPVADEVPRRLEPVLRGGALFVPASTVHVLRPTDGTALGTLDCDLVPDLIRVDERGWIYIAEESGHLRAFAPVPHLMLVR